MKNPSGISARALAELVGVSHTSINDAVAAGKLRRNADGLFDPKTALAAWFAGRVQRTASGAPSPPLDGPSLARLQQADFALRVEQRKLRLDAEKGKLIDRAKAEAFVFALAQGERDAMLNWPARVAPMMAAELGIDGHLMATALEAAVRRHLLERAAPDADMGKLR